MDGVLAERVLPYAQATTKAQDGVTAERVLPVCAEGGVATEGERAPRPPHDPQQPRGESGIRTHGAASGSTVFETARFDRSRISPSPWMGEGRLRTWMYKQTPSQRHDGARSSRAWTHTATTGTPWMGEGRLRTCRRPTSIDSTRSSPAPAGDDLAIRAQEDSNLRPLDPQSNALSRLSYGHIPVSPYIHALGRDLPSTRNTAEGLPERGDSNPRYPFGVQRLSRAPDSATLAPLPYQHPPDKASPFKREASAFSSQARKGGARDT